MYPSYATKNRKVLIRFEIYRDRSSAAPYPYDALDLTSSPMGMLQFRPRPARQLPTEQCRERGSRGAVCRVRHWFSLETLSLMPEQSILNWFSRSDRRRGSRERLLP